MTTPCYHGILFTLMVLVMFINATIATVDSLQLPTPQYHRESEKSYTISVKLGGGDRAFLFTHTPEVHEKTSYLACPVIYSGPMHNFIVKNILRKETDHCTRFEI